MRIFENWGFWVILGDCGCKYFLRDIKIYIPWVPGVHENPKLDLVWHLLFLKLFNLFKKYPIGKEKVMFYLIPLRKNVFVNFLKSAIRIILNLFEYVPYTITDY